MRRVASRPRPGWQARLEADGFPIHTADGPYWDESVCYELDGAEADRIEAATNELHARCLEAVEHVIRVRLYPRLGIPERAVPLVERSWEALGGEGAPSIYGRMDLACGDGPPKLLEYNADTPTALVEAAVLQWRWLEETSPGADQLNSIHERLVAGWKDLAPWLASPLHFSALDVAEDVLTASYLQDTAAQAGLATRFVEIRDLGWDARRRAFVDLEEAPVESLFKLYPWEWLLAEPFGEHLAEAATTFVEPPWKLVLSSKAILAVLWELFPDHPNLLPAYLEPRGMERYARKALFGREGAEVTLFEGERAVAGGARAALSREGFVYQAQAPLRPHDGRWPVVGSWLVQGEAAGIGIRESDGPITDDASRFVPHRLV